MEFIPVLRAWGPFVDGDGLGRELSPCHLRWWGEDESPTLEGWGTRRRPADQSPTLEGWGTRPRAAWGRIFAFDKPGAGFTMLASGLTGQVHCALCRR